MLYCGFCGSSLAENASFCANCGQKRSDGEAPTTLINRPSGASPEPPLTTQISQTQVVSRNQPQTTSRGQRLLIALLAFLVVIVACMGVLLYMLWRSPSAIQGSTSIHTPLSTPTISVTQTSTTTPTYPEIAGQYNGHIQNNATNIGDTLALTISQDHGSLAGNAIIGPKLLGSGPLMGVVDAAGNVQFKVHNTLLSEPLSFSGMMQPGGGLSGSYCSVNELNQCDGNAGKGTWSVA